MSKTKKKKAPQTTAADLKKALVGGLKLKKNREQKVTRPAIEKAAATLRPSAELTEAELRVQLGVARDNGDQTEAADLEARITRLQNAAEEAAPIAAADPIPDLDADTDLTAPDVHPFAEHAKAEAFAAKQRAGLGLPPTEGLRAKTTHAPPSMPTAADHDALGVEAHLRETEIADIEKELATARSRFETTKKAYQASCAAANVPCRYGDAKKGRGVAVAERVFFEVALDGAPGKVRIGIRGRPDTVEVLDIAEHKTSNALAASYCRKHVGDPAVVGNKMGSLGNRLRELFPLASTAK